MFLPESPLKETVAFLVELLNTHSPTGDTEKAISYVTSAVAGLPVHPKRTRKGGLVLTWDGDEAHPRALTAHVDTLGAMVRRINCRNCTSSCSCRKCPPITACRW